MNPNCARCGKIVYPTEKVNCLDKFWHKACFHCETCKMTLNMKNYKGYEKKPYCNAHYPKQSFTMVADTPENLRLKYQTELQSPIRYKEEFEKNKGKGFCVVTDTPELQRIKKIQDQISDIKYHEEFEKSRMRLSPGEGAELEHRNSQESTNYQRPTEQQQQQQQPPAHHVQPSNSVYQQPMSQSYGYKEPAAPASSQRNAPAGGSVSALSMTTTQPMRMRSPSRTVTPSSTCSRSMTGGCTARWSARGTRGCSPPTTWRPFEPREGRGRGAHPHSRAPSPSGLSGCVRASLSPSIPSPWARVLLTGAAS
ncbi:LIM and SH3 domain protein 1 isoform X1 [Lathamus discolor]|uniref:LIM and SH3 domain protein 1 isoform X1 n=1 Tax=Lathamus discolor TaxID=678569 RepID=UPI0032B767FB